MAKYANNVENERLIAQILNFVKVKIRSDKDTAIMGRIVSFIWVLSKE